MLEAEGMLRGFRDRTSSLLNHRQGRARSTGPRANQRRGAERATGSVRIVSVSSLVEQVAKDLRRPTLVLSVEGVLREGPAYDGVSLGELGEPLAQEGGWASVVLVAPD